MDQLHVTQFVHHELLHQDRQEALRGCDARTYAFLCRRQGGPRTDRSRRLSRLFLPIVRILKVRNMSGDRKRMHGAPDSAGSDAVRPGGEEKLVVRIDLGNPLLGPPDPAPSDLQPSEAAHTRPHAHRGRT